MRFNLTKSVLLYFVILFCICQKTSAQIPSNCFAIEGILVDACGTQEGVNEMLFFQIGANDLNVSNLTVAWPLNNNPYRNICQDATTAAKVAAFNRTILKCGLLVEPVAGVLPAGKKVIFFTSENVDTLLSSFAGLQDTIVAIFQCAGNTQGHFANFGTGPRTVSMTFSGTNGCTETATYHRDSLTNQSGAHAAQDGEGVYFSLSGAATYYWNPCMPPIRPAYVDAGANINVCRSPNPINLAGTADNDQKVHWYGGQGTFSRADTTVTTYIPSPLDVMPLYLYLTRRICATDSLVDSVRISFNPPATTTVNVTICSGGNHPVGTHIYTTTGSYIDTLSGPGGCDSIIFTNLTVDTIIYQTVNLSGCNQVTFNGNTYTSNTTLTQTTQYVNGCDSLIKTINISINHPSVFTQSPTICLGQTLVVGTHSYSSSGFYVDTLRGRAANNCDSIIQTTLSVVSPYNNRISLFDTCLGSYKGVTYTSSNTVRDTIVSQVTGCDSVYLTVTINIAQPALTTITNNVRICPGQSYFAGGQNQTTTGTYFDTTRTQLGGCDSIITVTNLSLVTPTYLSHRYDTCNAVTLNGVTYGSDTAIRQVISSALGCDSIVMLDTIHIITTNITVLSTALLPILQGDSTQLIINPSGNYQNILWTPNQWISNQHDMSPFVLPDVTTAYMVTGTDQNNCPVSGQIIVTVTPTDKPDFAMPTAFSPNGDGKNETYGPVLNPNTELTVFHIYNRWGQLVFDKDVSGTNEWDGNFKSAAQPAGTYMYFITVISATGKTSSHEGQFMLLH